MPIFKRLTNQEKQQHIIQSAYFKRLEGYTVFHQLSIRTWKFHDAEIFLQSKENSHADLKKKQDYFGLK
jgi:hypothetical protein